MTKEREALKLALEALEMGLPLIEDFGSKEQFNIQHKAIAAIYETLAQPEQDGKCKYCTDGCPACDARKLPEQEPVAWVSSEELLVMRGNALGGAKDWRINVGLVKQEGDVGLYTTPPQRTWVGLTDHEIEMIYAVTIKIRKKDIMPGEQKMFAKTIEHFLKERNT